MEIHELLRQRKDELGLSLADMEARFNLAGYEITRQAIGLWVSGKRRPPMWDIDFMFALGRVLEMSVSEIFRRIDYIPNGGDSGAARRAYDLIRTMPPDQQDLALRLIEQLARK